MNAIHFYFEHVLGHCPDFNGLRPKTVAKLPLVLSGAEVAAIFRAVDNLKHRSMLMLIYSAGLCLHELTNLRRQDIQFDRKRVFVRGGRGKKDRYSILSEKMAACLREYFHEYRTPHWLYEGRGGGHYSGRSVEAVFQRAAQKAGIQKSATVRTLRHSFAAHAGARRRYSLRSGITRPHSKTNQDGKIMQSRVQRNSLNFLREL